VGPTRLIATAPGVQAPNGPHVAGADLTSEPGGDPGDGVEHLAGPVGGGGLRVASRPIGGSSTGQDRRYSSRVSAVEQDEYGRPEPPLVGNEVETLLGFLDYQRATLAWKCAGLDDDQLRRALYPTSLNLAGMLKHLARVEDRWFSEVVAEAEPLEPWAGMPWAAEWESCAADSGEGLRQKWAARVEASRRVVATQLKADHHALDATHPAWRGQASPSLRWVLVHMIEEYARHNGHADLLRESIDGQTGE